MANEQNQNTQSGASTQKAKEQNFSDNTADLKKTNVSDTSTTESTKNATKDFYDQAKDTAGQVYGTAAEKTKSTIEEQKSNLATGLTSIADSIKQVGGSLRETDKQTGITELTAKYSDTLAKQIEQISRYFDNKDLREMARDVETFARRNPAIFIGSAFAVGLLAARFLKSSSSDQSVSRRQQSSQKHDAVNRNTENEFNTPQTPTSGGSAATRSSSIL